MFQPFKTYSEFRDRLERFELVERLELLNLILDPVFPPMIRHNLQVFFGR
jgi:hypothetical protein